MEFLTILTATDGDAGEGATCMTSGGLVDRQTAAAEDVVLWSDPVSIACIAGAAAAHRRLPAVA